MGWHSFDKKHPTQDGKYIVYYIDGGFDIANYSTEYETFGYSTYEEMCYGYSEYEWNDNEEQPALWCDIPNIPDSLYNKIISKYTKNDNEDIALNNKNNTDMDDIFYPS